MPYKPQNLSNLLGTSMEIGKVSVIGTGSMVGGISEILAMAGGGHANRHKRGRAGLREELEGDKWSLGKFIDSQRISQEDANTVLSRIKTNLNLEDGVKDTSFVIEAASEDLELKKQIFAKLDRVAPKNSILTDTSFLSIAEISKCTGRPEKIVGIHFFNPPAMTKLVEVIKGERTSDETINLTLNLAKRLRKEVVIVNNDSVGIVNRVSHSVLNEAFWSVHRGEVKPIALSNAPSAMPSASHATATLPMSNSSIVM